jgi:hypothetical protein
MPCKTKEGQAASARRHYLKNKACMIARAKAFTKFARARNVAYVLEYLLRHPCIVCKNDDVEVLEFDHVRGKKEGNVSDLAIRPVSLEKLQREIDKCEVRCANCHRKITRQSLWSGLRVEIRTNLRVGG